MVSRLVRAWLVAGVVLVASSFSAEAAPIVCLTESGDTTCLGTKTVILPAATFSLDLYATDAADYELFALDYLRWDATILTLLSVTPGTLGNGGFFGGDLSVAGELSFTTDTLTGGASGSLAVLNFQALAVGVTALTFEALDPNDPLSVGPVAFQHATTLDVEGASQVSGASVDVQRVPEPASLTLFGLGLGLAGVYLRSRR